MADYHAMIEITHLDDTNGGQLAVRKHSRESVELLSVETGQFTITCGGDSLTAAAGDIIFVNRNIPLSLLSATPGGGRLCSCVVNPLLVLGLGQPDWEQQYLVPILYNSSLRYLRITESHSAYSRCASCLRELIRLDADSQDGRELLIRAQLLQLWYELYRYVTATCATPAPQASLLDEHRVREAIAYIQKHYMGTVTLEDIADTAMISKSECCRCFKRALGITPFEYLMKYRITQAAKRMRQYPLESIAQLAGSVGFNNTSYFNKLFKNYMGCTPTEFKKRIMWEPLS